MITYFSKTMQYECDPEPVNRGGEGAIYQTAYPELLLKIYHANRRTRSRLAKLISMTNNKTATEFKGVEFAWPVDIIHEKDGRFAGFAMLRAEGDSRLIDIIADSSRPGYNWRSRVELGRNLAIAVKSAHDAGFVIGDLNARNILVTGKNGKISMIDTDSYHITDPDTGIIYPCEVGVPELLAPEIQGKDLSGANPLHNRNTDNFSLAVLLFSLLMNGAHPFTDKLSNAGSSSIGTLKHQDAIRNCQSVFFRTRSTGGIPAYAPELDILPDDLRLLFFRAFIQGHANPRIRPAAGEWITVLEKLANETIACPDNKHEYYSGNKSCPWCRVEAKIRQLAVKSASAVQGNNPALPVQLSAAAAGKVITSGSAGSKRSKGSFAAISFLLTTAAIVLGAIIFKQVIAENPQVIPGLTPGNSETAISLYIAGGFICWLIYILAFSHKPKSSDGRNFGLMSHLLAIMATLTGPLILLLMLSLLMYALIAGIVIMGVYMLINNS